MQKMPRKNGQRHNSVMEEIWKKVSGLPVAKSGYGLKRRKKTPIEATQKSIIQYII